MKVIHIVHGKANPKEHNGISRVVYYLNKYEKLKGCDSQIWAIVDGVKSHFTHRRDEFVTVECFPRVWTPFGKHEIINELIKNKDSIDLVHFHLIWFYDKNIIAAALKRAGIPFIITTHGTYSKPHAYTGKRLLAKWLFERNYLNMATELHAITREEGTGLQKYGYTGRSFVAYNGIELEEIPAARKDQYFADKTYRHKLKLIWVGVLREDKNLRSLIKAVALLPTEIRELFVCILVGPDYRGNAAKYLSLSAELGCRDNFDYVGPLYDQNKYDAIQSADAYVMPSFSEVFSLAMLDAMGCGKPCLATSGCGYNYFIKSDFFVACEPYPQDIARGLEELLARRDEWPTLGRNARRMVEEKFNWPTITDVMIENYARISGKP
ncbi:MAG TPA: glycosyltransferase family 4 protein [Geobacteraceae bacterium]